MLREEPGIASAFENLSLLLGRCKIHIGKKSLTQLPMHWSSVVLGFVSIPVPSRAWPD